MPSNVETELGLEGLFYGKITHLSFDCPIKLREAFKTETKDNGTSVCKELQKYMVSYVATSRIKKHALGNTLSKALPVELTIKNLNFEQYVQSRPRRLMRTDNENKIVKPNLCTIAHCKKPAVGTGLYIRRNTIYRLCESHLREYSKFSLDWKVIRGDDSMESLKSEVEG